MIRIKNIAGMAENWCNSVIVELENGLFAWVPTLNRDSLEEIDYQPSSDDYAYSPFKYARWVETCANGYAPEDIFHVAMRNFARLFEECPMSDEQVAEFKKWRRNNPEFVSEERRCAEHDRRYCKVDDPFAKTLEEIFSHGPIDPRTLTPDPPDKQ